MKTILITGGAGFLGSHLCAKLLRNGDQIYCLDNFFTGNKDNIEYLMLDKNFTLIEHDIVESIKLNVNVDEIYNLACPASPPHYQKNPIFTLNTCFTGVYNVLEFAKKCNAKVFQASTSEVYGDPLIHPQDEAYRGNVNTFGPRACYDEGKRVAETLFYEYNKIHNLRIKIVRIFNTYGPRMQFDDGRVVSNFIIQALQGKDITVYGNGLQTRSFCYVDDLIDGFIKLMNSDDRLNYPINIGNPNEFSINELCEVVLRLTNSNSKIIYTDLPQDDPLQRKPVISKAIKELGWNPKIQLEDGIKHTIKYFQDYLKLKG